VQKQAPTLDPIRFNASCNLMCGLRRRAMPRPVRPPTPRGKRKGRYASTDTHSRLDTGFPFFYVFNQTRDYNIVYVRVNPCNCESAKGQGGGEVCIRKTCA